MRFHYTGVDDLGQGMLRVHGQLEAAGTSVPLEFDAQVIESGESLEFDATTVADPQEFGMSRGTLNMIRPSAILHVKARAPSGSPR